MRPSLVFTPIVLLFLGLTIFPRTVNGQVSAYASPRVLANTQQATNDRVAPIVNRAINALGGEEALNAKQFRVMYLGTRDLNVVHQGRFPGRPMPSRKQDTLIIDVDGHRAVMRSEQINSDGSPSIWRSGVLNDTAYLWNLKTGLKFPRSPQAVWLDFRLRIPQVVLQELRQHLKELSFKGTEFVDGRAHDVLLYAADNAEAFKVLFDRATGQLTGYEFDTTDLFGKTLRYVLFKTYKSFTNLERFPSGLKTVIGSQVYEDFDVVYATTGTVASDEWLKPLPEDLRAPSVTKHPRAITELKPGIYQLSNVNGRNAFAADLGDSLAVVDAPSQDASRIIIEMLREKLPGKPIRYVIPTHHHDDHIGGIKDFAAVGATVVTSPGNVAFVKKILRAANPQLAPKLEIVNDRRVFGDGKSQLEIYRLEGGFHTFETLVAYFPAYGIVFEADVSDYHVDAKHFLDFAFRRNLKIEQIYRAHSFGPTTLADWESDEPGN